MGSFVIRFTCYRVKVSGSAIKVVTISLERKNNIFTSVLSTIFSSQYKLGWFVGWFHKHTKAKLKTFTAMLTFRLTCWRSSSGCSKKLKVNLNFIVISNTLFRLVFSFRSRSTINNYFCLFRNEHYFTEHCVGICYFYTVSHICLFLEFYFYFSIS